MSKPPCLVSLSTQLTGRIIAAIAELQDEIPADANYSRAQAARTHNALALYCGMGGSICLTPVGELIYLGWDDEGPVEPLDAEQRIAVLVAGTECYPWLAELLPVRQVGP